MFKKKGENPSEQRIERKVWTKPSSPGLMSKRFPIEEWDKHFSPIGSKRAGISTNNTRDLEVIEREVKEFDVREFEMSAWNERMADLRQKAGISTDDRSLLISDRQLYGEMLRQARPFTELAEESEELSLRDINRYQFRRNRSDDEIPRQRVGGE